MFRDEFAKLLRSVAFMLEEANKLEVGEVVHAKRRVPVATERSQMKLRGSFVRLSVDFGTA